MSIDVFSLAGRTSLVTTGTRGVGAVCATLLAERGAAVVITSSRSPDRAEPLAREIEAVGGSAANPDDGNRSATIRTMVPLRRSVSRAKSPNWLLSWPRRRRPILRARNSLLMAACAPDAPRPRVGIRGTAR